MYKQIRGLPRVNPLRVRVTVHPGVNTGEPSGSPRINPGLTHCCPLCFLQECAPRTLSTTVPCIYTYIHINIFIYVNIYLYVCVCVYIEIAM